MKIIGTCGNCGGAVALSDAWLSVLPQRPRCQQCGAHPAQSFGSVIPMEPKRDKVYVSNWNQVGEAPGTSR